MDCYSQLVQELEDLGYIQTLKPECVPLVSRLLSDLKTATESLDKYVKLSQQAFDELDSLELGAAPYKCDNAKLIRECNELHLAFIQFKEQHEKTQKDLRSKIVSLEEQLKDCQSEKKDLSQQLRRFYKEPKILQGKGEKLHSKQSSDRKSSDKSSAFLLKTEMASADQRIATLNKEIRRLKDNQIEIIKTNEFMKTQLENRDGEILRLNNLLEGGRPFRAISKDCCYKNMDNKLDAYEEEIKSLKIENNSLQNQLKEAISKQHEAMRRALHLAERNKQLEKEMNDIDQIALQVEAECNDTVKTNVAKVMRLQDRMNEAVITIQNLERDNARLKQEKTELSSDLDAIKLEKKRLHSALEIEREDKKRLNDRINSLTIIEHDLNMEIDRLVRLTGEQKFKIAELECQVVTGKPQGSVDQPKSSFTSETHRQFKDIAKKLPSQMDKATGYGNGKITAKPSSKTIEHKKGCKKSSSQQLATHKESSESKQSKGSDKCCCEAGKCMKQMMDILSKERECRDTQAFQQIESLKQEKEYFMKEYHKISEQMRNIPSHDDSNRVHQQYEELLKKIDEKNQLIFELQREVKNLAAQRMETHRQFNDSEIDGLCHKTNCKRKSREVEIHREEANHLLKENVALKAKIHELNQSTVFDQDRMKKAFQEMEGHIRKLEDERRELVIGQTTSRSNTTQLEEECNMLKDQLRSTQTELNSVRASYNQLKNLHDQTDRALSEAQSQLLRAETELQGLNSKMNTTHRESAGQEREISRLQGDIEVMKRQLNAIDKEKDDLLNVVDDKTEKIDQLEGQLRDKKNVISVLETELNDLKRKLGKISEETSSHEFQLRSSRQDIAALEKDLENEKKMKESAFQENKRLRGDLASLTCDCRDARNELELSKRQVEDLKRQLQHYVAEVKRTEDLISHKELERTEILDHFKCLSDEANILESNNHTLENEATQTRVQLSVALEHASDLERKIDNQEAIIRSYEKQIADLTSQVASMEIQMKQGNSHFDRVETELKQMKDLCLKLDKEKDDLKRELRGKEDHRGTVERNIDKITRENGELKRALDKDKNSLGGLEKLLQDARQEVIEHRLLNQDLQSELTKLREKVAELEDRLATTSEQVDMYQEKALQYSQQNKQLRRDIANERFSRAREDDSKRYPSL